MKISQEKGSSKNKLRYDVIYEINIMSLEIKICRIKKLSLLRAFHNFFNFIECFFT